MNHPFMAAVATELAHRGIATLRYQFPHMERGVKQPDPPRPRLLFDEQLGGRSPIGL